jgi:hypothetical protein
MIRTLPPWAPYVIPFGLYLALTAVEVRFPSQYPLLYCVKIVLVAIAAIAMRPKWDLPGRLPWGWMAVAVAAGVVLNWVWFAVDRVTPHPHWLAAIVGSRPSFNPYTGIANPAVRWVFLMIRFAGLVVLIPYLEELFYRDFVLRWVADPDDFRRVPMGAVRPVAVAVSTVLFASTHPEWLSAIVFALAMCALVRLSRDIRVCMAAHAATNLALGISVLATGNWRYW